MNNLQETLLGILFLLGFALLAANSYSLLEPKTVYAGDRYTCACHYDAEGNLTGYDCCPASDASCSGDDCPDGDSEQKE